MHVEDRVRSKAVHIRAIDHDTVEAQLGTRRADSVREADDDVAIHVDIGPDTRQADVTPQLAVAGDVRRGLHDVRPIRTANGLLRDEMPAIAGRPVAPGARIGADH